MAGYDIGPRIGIKGESEFNAQIKKINNSLKEYGSEMKALTAEFESNENSQQALISKNKVLQKQLEAQGQKMSTLQLQYDKEVAKLRELANAYQKISAEMGENSTEASKAESAYNKQAESVSKLKVSMNETRSYINKLNNSIDENEKALDGVDDVARDAARGLNKAGDEAETATRKFLENKEGAEELKKGLSSIGKGIIGAGKGVVTAGGVLAGSAIAGSAAIRSLTESTEELRSGLSKLDQNAKDSGVSIGVVRDAFNDLNVVSGETDSSIEATSNLLQAGFTESNLQKAIEGISGAYLKFPDTLKIESLADSLQETLATGEATGQFGELLDRLGIGAENFSNNLSQISGSAERQNYALKVLADAGLTDTYNAWKDNNEAMIENMKANYEYEQSIAELSEKLLPFSTAATESMTSIVDAASEAIDYLLGVFEQVENGDMTIAEAIKKILGDGAQIVTSLINGIVEQIPLVIDTAREVLGSFLNTLTENFPEIIQKGLDILLSLTSGMRENIGTVIDAGIDLVMKLVDGFVQALPAIIEKAPLIISNIVGAINDNMPKIINAGLQIIMKLVEGLIQNIPVIIENMPRIISAIVDVLTAYNWLGLGTQIIKGVINGIGSMAGALSGAVSNCFSGVTRFITSLPSKAVGWGRDFINGLKNGIMSGVSAIVNAVRNVANRIRSFLHFSRPDEGPLRDYETWMPDMLTGMADSVYKNLDIIQDAAKTISGTINSNITDDRNGVMRSAQTSYSSSILVEGDNIILDGKVIGKTAERYISNGQVARMKARGAFA